MWLSLVLPLLAQLFANVDGKSVNRSCNEDLDNSTEIQGTWRLEPPFGVQLRAIYQDTAAYRDFKERMPSLLDKMIESINLNSDEISKRYGTGSLEELETFIESVNMLKNEIATNQLLIKLPLAHNEHDRDAAMWNDHLQLRKEIEGPNLRWYFTKFILSGTYPFRRLSQTLALTKKLKNFDPFEKQKQSGFTKSINSVTLLAQYTLQLLNRMTRPSTAEQRSELITLLKISLWANRFDLVSSGGNEVNFEGNPVDRIKSFEKDLLIDDTKVVWDILNNPNRTSSFVIVDIVMDNAGYELFSDLCLASFLVDHGIAHKVRFHVKEIPWYVSDVNSHDFLWVIEYMRNSSNPDLKTFGDLCAMRLEHGSWSIESDPFWTTYLHFGEMKQHAPALYNQLSEATLVIFKGDLNYRKVVGDVNWEYDTTLDTVLSRLDFRPSNVVVLRTLKAQICVGLGPKKVNQWKKDKKLMENGQYGVIDAAVYATSSCPDNQ